MSATTTSVSTTTSSATSASATCTGSMWELPTKDIACALPKSGNATDILDKCCKHAKVSHYNDGCGLYCLAQEQSAKDLSDCFRDEGAKDGQFFCSGGNSSLTATAAVPSKTDSDSDSKTGTSTGSSASSTSSDSAAIALSQPVSKSGLGLLAMLVCSALMGVVA
ncbi:uncharacterized protein KD926_000447 [Aspergillus affinis]|uniref:uncharacterized protein n=1 Tax=Aspergillus affinis TaxID=1070780 RepID=UPI0022FDF71B|nr:uncharacterized protein KD926_000447 [Aspergillus affinis]KAI9044536.1 hypothetical protein KD926_000447 [Aspergillus affinis]